MNIKINNHHNERRNLSIFFEYNNNSNRRFVINDYKKTNILLFSYYQSKNIKWDFILNPYFPDLKSKNLIG